jgi:serine/threonine protein kinase
MKTCPICEKSWPSNHANCPTDGALLIDLRELEPGTVIRGKYRIVRQLGRGGMGTVYLAEHILLNRPRALKFISSELSQDAAFLRRFRREAQAAIELRHPNIVEVVDLDQAEDGSPYIAMEYVEGPDLRNELAGGVFPVERALHIARGIALGLGAAHAKGIVHRDVKPENILLASGKGSPEIPKLLDFGIAAMKETATAVSRTHGLMLTPPYAAPEQWKGMAAEELDGRADLYALGGVFYEMLTGQTTFHAHNTEGWMYQHIHEQPQPPSQLRPELANWPGLDSLVLRLLAKDREQRPRDAGELLSLLDAVRYVAPSARRETVPIDTMPKERQATVPDIVFSGGGHQDAREERPPEHEPVSKSFLQYGDQPESGEGSGPPRRSWNSLAVWGLLAVVLVLVIYGALHFFGRQEPAQPGSSSTPATSAMQPATISTSTATKPSTPATNVPATIPGGGAQADALTWTDPATGLMWAKSDNGWKKNVYRSEVTWQQATDYCRNLQLDGHSDWRLPTIDELQGIYDPNANVNGYHVKGNLQLMGMDWSSSPATAPGEAWYFAFESEYRGSFSLGSRAGLRALCVRGTTSQSLNPAVNSAPVVPSSNPGGGAQADELTWTDPATGLMWTKKENSSGACWEDNSKSVNWQQATDYCRNLRLAGHSDWRLPAIGELQGIYDPNANVSFKCWHVKGCLQSDSTLWSSPQLNASQGNFSGTALGFKFSDGTQGPYSLDYIFCMRALCVRRSR